MKINKQQIRKLVKENLVAREKKTINERIYRIVKEEYAKIKSMNEDWQKDNNQMRGKDLSKGKGKKDPKDNKWLPEGAASDEWDMVDAVVVALGHEGTLDALVRALPSDAVRDAMEYIGQMHEIPMELDEETKPHEVDRHPSDTPADRIREETKPHEADRKPADTPEDRIRK